jgi:hypothetical protein
MTDGNNKKVMANGYQNFIGHLLFLEARILNLLRITPIKLVVAGVGFENSSQMAQLV